MKALILLAIIGVVAVNVSEARHNAFMCSGECYSYDNGPFCMSNGSVVCDNCKRDEMMCEGLTSTDCTSACD